MNKLHLLCLGMVMFGISLPGKTQVDARMFRSPDISSTHIAFIYAGDIWVVDKGGGSGSGQLRHAERLHGLRLGRRGQHAGKWDGDGVS